METLGVGVIGFGFIGKIHTYGYKNIPLFYDPVPFETRLVGVATSRDETAAKARVQGGFQFGTSDWRELIARDDIQVINICSPNSQHCEQVLAAMKAGKHIYCDKPLVVTGEEAARVSDAMRQWRGVGQITLQNRFFPATLRARQLVEEGFLGKIISFRGEFLHAGSVEQGRPMGWKQLASEGGGVLQDLGTHILDAVDWLAGPIESVCARMRILYPERPAPGGGMQTVEADDQTVMLVQMANGALGTIEASKIATGTEDEMRFEIHGDKGAIRFNLMDPNYLDAFDLREPDAPLGGQRGWRRISCIQRYERPGGYPGVKFSIGWTRAHMHCLFTFLSAVAAGRPGEPSFQRGLALQSMAAAVERSARTGRWERVSE